MKVFTLTKKERLSHQSRIDGLFQHGIGFTVHPLRTIYLQEDSAEKPGVQLLVSVPSKKFRKAVTRNRIKRLIREAYRLNKHLLSAQLINSTVGLRIGFVYIGDKIDITYKEIELSVINALHRIMQSDKH
jgi:ribonuclease P protein component